VTVEVNELGCESLPAHSSPLMLGRSRVYHVKLPLFIITLVATTLGCSRPSVPLDPIDRAVSAESSKPTPQGMWAQGITAPATNAPAVVAIRVLSAPYWQESPTNVVVLETRSVRISHKDSKGLLPPVWERWTALLVDTRFGRKVIFLQCKPIGTNLQASWTYFTYDL